MTHARSAGGVVWRRGSMGGCHPTPLREQADRRGEEERPWLSGVFNLAEDRRDVPPTHGATVHIAVVFRLHLVGFPAGVSKIARRRRGHPGSDGPGRPIGREGEGEDVPLGAGLPAQRRQAEPSSRLLEEGHECGDGALPTGLEGMTGIRHIEEVALTGEGVVVHVQRVERPVPVVRCEDDEFRDGEVLAIAEGVDEGGEGDRTRLAGQEALRQPTLRILGDLTAELSPGVTLVAQLSRQIEIVIDPRGDRLDPGVHHGGEPDGPSPFRGTTHDEASGRDVLLALAGSPGSRPSP